VFVEKRQQASAAAVLWLARYLALRFAAAGMLGRRPYLFIAARRYPDLAPSR